MIGPHRPHVAAALKAYREGMNETVAQAAAEVEAQVAEL